MLPSCISLHVRYCYTLYLQVWLKNISYLSLVSKLWSKILQELSSMAPTWAVEVFQAWEPLIPWDMRKSWGQWIIEASMPSSQSRWIIRIARDGGKLQQVGCWQVNTLRLRQNGPHFPNYILKCIFLDENDQILIRISLKFVPWVLIDDKPALVYIMLGA